MKNKRIIGFTLIECLLAMTIFSILITSVYSILRTGLKAYKSTEVVAEKVKRVRWFLNDLSVELRNAVQGTEISFYGETDGISFITIISHYSDDGEIPEVRVISYKIEKDEISNKITIVKTVSGSTDHKNNTLDMSDVIKSLHLSYMKLKTPEGNVWLDSWDNNSMLPSLVKIELVVGDTSFESEDFKLTQLIPISSGREIGKRGEVFDIAEKE